MKKYFHKIAAYSALILVSALSFSVSVFADAEKKPGLFKSLANADKNLSIIKHKVLAEKSQQIILEAKDTVTGTEQALMALENNDVKGAQSILQGISKKLDIVLAKNPALALVTADMEADIFDFQGDAKTVERELKQADDLLNNGKLQNARQILAELASEMRITTIGIPLGTFPAAIRNAETLLYAGKTNEAALVLDEVLNTLVERTEVIPLPILRAEALLTIASELEHRDDLSKDESRIEILKYADVAKEKLKLAELLGYGGRDDYKLLYNSIDEIKDVLHSEKSVSVWAKIKQNLADLRNKIIQPKK